MAYKQKKMILSRRWFILKLKSREYVYRIIQKHWSLGSIPILFKVGHPCSMWTQKKFDVILVWVKIPRIPWEVWNWDSFRYIGNVLGEFIDVDMTFTLTKRMSVVRILVSFNIISGIGRNQILFGSSRIASIN